MMLAMLCAAGSWTASAAAAQDASVVRGTQSDGRATATLAEALELARRYNPDLRIAANAVERAAAAERSGWGSLLPQVSVSGSVSGFSSRTQTGRNEFGQPVALDEAATFSGTSGSGGLNASMVLFDGFGLINDVQAARAGGRAADAGYEVEVARIEAEVRRRFYTALGARQQIEIEERLLAAAEQRLEAMRAMVPSGRTTPQDVLGADADVARQELALERARTGAYNAQLALREIIGVEEVSVIEPVGEFPELVDPAELGRDALIERALGASPRMRAARNNAERAEHAADAAGATRWPTVRLSAGVDRGVSVAQFDQLTSFPWNRGLGLSLSASVPVFAGFRVTEQVVRARTASDDATEQLRRTRLAVERAVRSAIGEAELAYAAVRLAERGAELALERAEVGQEGFQRGLIGFTDLQQVVDRAALAERAMAGAYVEYAGAIATLREVVGGELPTAGDR